MNSRNQTIGFLVILMFSVAAIGVASVHLNEAPGSLPVYNLIRSLIFGSVCLYLYRNPGKINFTGSDDSRKKIKASYLISSFFAVFNLAISVALYFDR